jgi:hypothetical protein
METRPYFLIGDLLANGFAGAVIGSLMTLVFGPSWNMFLAMLVGMGIGMLVSTFIALPLGALFGAMEVMVPVMTTGMVAGMVVSMAAAMEEVPFMRGAELGVMCGVVTLIACYVANSLIRRRASKWTS